MFAFDFETYPVIPGCPLPQPVVLSIYDSEESEVTLYHSALDSCISYPCDGFEPDYTKPTYGDTGADVAAVAMLLTSIEQDRPIVAHNSKYDLGLLFKYYDGELVNEILNKGLAWCTMLGEKLMRIEVGESKFMVFAGDKIRTGYSLSAIVLRYFGVNISQTKKSDSWRLKYGTLIDDPIEYWPQEAVEYAVEDPLWCGAAYYKQKDSGCGNLVDMPRQVAAGFDLNLSTEWGLVTDREAIDLLAQRARKHCIEVERILKDLGILRKSGSKNMAKFRSCVWRGYDGDPPLTDTGVLDLEKGLRMPPGDLVEEAIDLLFEKDIDLWKLSKEQLDSTIEHDFDLEPGDKALNQIFINPFKRVATDRDTLGESDSDELYEYTQHSMWSTIESSFLPKLYTGLERPIQPSYDELKATGRTSSYGDLNIQNQPRVEGLRECFVPREGRVFIACDYDSIELRAFAQTCLDVLGFSLMAQKYQEDPDFDPHAYFASVMLGIDLRDMLERLKSGDKEAKDARQLAKIPNYGYIGGMGPRALIGVARGYGIRLTLAMAKELRQVWFNTWPEGGPYLHNHIRSLLHPVHNKGTFVLPRSRRARQGSYCQLANYGFQGPAADGIKNAMRLFNDRAYVRQESGLYGSRMSACIHDELLISAPIPSMRGAARELEEVMIEGMAQEIKDIEIRCTSVIMDRWYKGADPVYDENGEIGIYRKPLEKIYA